MSQSDYHPPAVWTWEPAEGGQFANVNRPISGATHEQVLPRGSHSFQLYSMATPNGVKVTLLFEELLEAGFSAAEYDAYPINIMDGEQFGSGFTALNPNSKIPVLLDLSGDEPLRLFESGAILMHLAEKFGAFIPKADNPRGVQLRAECLSWLFWQMGSAPFLGGGFGHFYAYAPKPLEYPINRYTMEVKRQLDVLDKHLANNTYLCGDDYTIADMAVWPWYGELVINDLYGASEFLSVTEFAHVQRWARQIGRRPAVKRGRIVNRFWGEESEQLSERHSRNDFNF